MRMTYQGIAVAEVTSLPGCSQVAVVHAANVLPEHRGRGVGYAAHIDRLRALHDSLGYDLAVCTAEASNLAQIAILRKAGWTKVAEFVSRRTGHPVTMWVRPLGTLP